VSKVPFEFFVDQVNGQWAINHNGRYTGPYATRDDAINTAIESATGAAQSDTRGAEVMLRGEDGRFTTIWRASQALGKKRR
jgi:hypothetical protein